jgi:hypothetical protein
MRTIALGWMALAGLGSVAAAQVNASASARLACDSTALLTVSTATTTQIIALAAGKSIHVCGFVINAGGTTTARLVSGTGTNCATGQANRTPPFNLTNGATVSFGNGVGYLIKAPAGAALCVTNTAAQAANVLVVYTQF